MKNGMSKEAAGKIVNSALGSGNKRHTKDELRHALDVLEITAADFKHIHGELQTVTVKRSAMLTGGKDNATSLD